MERMHLPKSQSRFQKKKKQTFIRFLDNLFCYSASAFELCRQLLAYTQVKIKEKADKAKLLFTMPERTEIPEEGICLPDFFLEVPGMMLAEQLTLIEYTLYKQIEVNWVAVVCCWCSLVVKIDGCQKI